MGIYQHDWKACILRVIVISALLVVAMLLPYMPGRYDPLAILISNAAQLVGILGLVYIPIGFLWLAHKLRDQARMTRGQPRLCRQYQFAVTVLVTSIIVSGILIVATFLAEQPVLTLVLAVMAVIAILRAVPAVRRIKDQAQDSRRFYGIPLYLIILPIAALMAQFLIAEPAMHYSRSRVIAASAPLIQEIDSYHKAHGQYPDSLNGLHQDYLTSVVGIAQYYYSPRADAYNLHFEQPRFLLFKPGTRENVAYNPDDKHVILSHAAWNMTWNPGLAATWQGWYASHDADAPHWKCFWFD